MTSTSGLDQYFQPLTLDGLNAFTQSVKENALLVNGTNSMLADLDMGSHAIKNLADAVTADEAVSLGQLTTSLGNYVDLTSSQTVSGAKTFSSQVVFTGATKTNLVATDIPNAGARTWLDSSVFQTLAGSKNWTNSQTFSGQSVTVSSSTTANLLNGALCGSKRLQNVADPQAAQDASTKSYVDATDARAQAAEQALVADLATKVNKAGDTMSGDLNMGSNAVTSTANPTTADALTRKGYVDTGDALRVLKAGDTMSGDLAMGGNRVTGLADGAAVSDAAAVGQVLLRNGTQAMTGNLNLGSNRVIGLAEAVAGTEAVNLNQLTSAKLIQTTQTVTTTPFAITDATPTVTLCNFDGGLVSLPASGVSQGKILTFINVFNGPNSASFWSNVGTGSIDGVTGSQQTVELRYMQSVTFLARGSGAYVTLSTDLLPPHSRVKADYGSNELGFWTWDGNVLNSTAKRLTVGSSQVTAYVPVVRRAWSGGELVKTRVFNTAYGGSGLASLTAGQFVYWKSVSYTLDSNHSSAGDVTLTVTIDMSYHLSGNGRDNVIAFIEDVTNGGVQLIARKSHYYDGNGGGGTRGSVAFPLVGSYTPNHNLNQLARSLRVTILNDSNDTLWLCYYIDGALQIKPQDTWSMVVAEYKNY